MGNDEGNDVDDDNGEDDDDDVSDGVDAGDDGDILTTSRTCYNSIRCRVRYPYCIQNTTLSFLI